MARYQSSRILLTVLTVIIIIIAIAGLVALARLLFFSGAPKDTQSPVDTSKQALLDTTDGSSVSMTVRGPIVADENFRSYQITVSPSARDIQTYKGYLDTTIDQKSLPNSTAAYTEFVYALNKANASAGKELDKEKNDIRGICAVGRVYEFKIMKEGQARQTLWTSTCSGSPGSLRANVSQLANLYWAQIPDSKQMIQALSLE